MKRYVPPLIVADRESHGSQCLICKKWLSDYEFNFDTNICDFCYFEKERIREREIETNRELEKEREAKNGKDGSNNKNRYSKNNKNR